MPHAMSQASEDIISGILNWVCPECGGRMGGRTKEFKCQGECLTDWRDVSERRVGKPSKVLNARKSNGQPTIEPRQNMIKLKRVYESTGRDDGKTFLVERLWPRGVKKTALADAIWLKDVAPSTGLRKWFGHDPKK